MSKLIPVKVVTPKGDDAVARAFSDRKLGSLLEAIGREAQLTDAEINLIGQRDQTPPGHAGLE